MRALRRTVVWGFGFALLALTPGRAAAQIEDLDHFMFLPREAETGEVEASSLQVYRLPLGYTARKLDDHPWGLKITLPVSFGFHDVNATTSLGEYFERLRTMSVTPGIEFQVPVAERWVLKPFAEVGVGGELSGKSDSGIEALYSAGLKCRGVFPRDSARMMFGGEVLYRGSTSEAVAGNFGSVGVGVDSQWQLGASKSGLRYLGGVYGIYRRFADLRLDFGLPEPTNIRNTYEAGFSFSTDPVFRLWKIRFPWMAVGYRFGDGVGGFRISLSFPF